MLYLCLLFLCVEHVGVDAQRSQHAHHQLLLPQPRAQLIGRRGEASQPIGAHLQLSLPLGCSLIGRLPAGVWGSRGTGVGDAKCWLMCLYILGAGCHKAYSLLHCFCLVSFLFSFSCTTLNSYYSTTRNYISDSDETKPDSMWWKLTKQLDIFLPLSLLLHLLSLSSSLTHVLGIRQCVYVCVYSVTLKRHYEIWNIKGPHLGFHLKYFCLCYLIEALVKISSMRANK